MNPAPTRRAVFLDRDGVLVEDVDLLTRADQLRVLPGVPAALARLQQAGFVLLVVTNQTVVARGMCTEDDVRAVHVRLQEMLHAAGGPTLDGWYVCPHHPKGQIPAYRLDCDCRKPKPGLLWRGASEHGVDLRRSFIIGDRPTDIGAGANAGCRTILVQTGRHTAPLIETTVPLAPEIRPDRICPDLASAVDWILGGS